MHVYLYFDTLVRFKQTRFLSVDFNPEVFDLDFASYDQCYDGVGEWLSNDFVLDLVIQNTSLFQVCSVDFKMLVLFETPAGLALLKVLDERKLS